MVQKVILSIKVVFLLLTSLNAITVSIGQNFLKHFRLNELSSVQITSVFPCDVILYHSELSALERAQILKTILNL